MKLSGLAKKLIFFILIVSSICIVASVIYYRSPDFLGFMYGVLLGTAASVAKVFLLERAVNKALSMDQKSAGIYVSGQHILRLLFTASVLLVGALVQPISLWGVIAGIFSYQIALYGVKFTSKAQDKSHKGKEEGGK